MIPPLNHLPVYQTDKWEGHERKGREMDDCSKVSEQMSFKCQNLLIRRRKKTVYNQPGVLTRCIAFNDDLIKVHYPDWLITGLKEAIRHSKEAVLSSSRDDATCETLIHLHGRLSGAMKDDVRIEGWICLDVLFLQQHNTSAAWMDSPLFRSS